MVRNEPAREEAVAAPMTARREVESKRGKRGSRKRIVDIPNEQRGVVLVSQGKRCVVSRRVGKSKVR